MASEIALSVEESAKKSTAKKYKTICTVLLALLVIASPGLGLGLRRSKPESQAKIWTCDKFCCGETRLESSLCSCSDDCLQRKDCCTDYQSVCQGETEWMKEECSTANQSQCPEGFDLPPLILFSMDGFGAEYLQTWHMLMPNINKLKMCGIHAKYMRGVYPTKTFPNHYTIATGLYPESHGIIDNNMYDVNLNMKFSLSSKKKEDPAWWSGQPIWLTAMYQGLKAGTYFWPGSDVAINSTFPSKYMLYNTSVPFGERVFTLLKWLDLPKTERPNFYTLYVEEPDSAGHKGGPVSANDKCPEVELLDYKVVQALQLVDQAFGMLMEGLKQRNLHNCVNIILLADHGMDQNSCDQMEYMTDYFPEINFYMYEGPAPRIRSSETPQDFYSFNSEGIVKNLSLKSVDEEGRISNNPSGAKRLSTLGFGNPLYGTTDMDWTCATEAQGNVPPFCRCRKSDQHFKPYLSPDLPKRLHYAKNVRIDKVHLMMDRQWLGVRSKAYKFCGGGYHGYDGGLKSMGAIFLAHGPGFKEKTEVEAFENIEVYNLLCDLLHIQPAPNNGTHGSLNHLLKAPFYEPSHPEEVSKSSVCGFTNPLPTESLECSCPELQNKTVLERVNQRLNLTSDEITATEKENMPFGRPRVMQKNKEHCLLYHREYVSGFGKAIRMPMWSSYTIPKQQGDTSPLPPPVSDCLRADVRVTPSESQKCSFYLADENITHGFLYPPANNRTSEGQYDALITSNLVPMYEEFKKLWHYFHNVLLIRYAAERNGVNVISGPVFDYNYDGRFDAPDEITKHVVNTTVPIPTHYFVVLTSCKNNSHTPINCPGWLDVLPFIIPHRPTNMESCPEGRPEAVWIEERWNAHVARVRDVELLTGLDFYQEKAQPVSEILQLKTYLPILETPT